MTHPDGSLLRQAADLGLVTAAELAAGAVAVRPVVGSAQVRSLNVRGRPLAYLRAPAGPAAESRHSDVLAGLVGLDLAPALLATTDDGSWLGVVPGTALGSQSRGAADLVQVCQAWGQALARLHRSRPSRPAQGMAPRPALLAGDATEATRQARRGSAWALVRTALQTDYALRAAAEAAAGSWWGESPTHNNLRSEHVLVEVSPVLRVRFVGFGSAGLGDPAWDLATALDNLAELAKPWGVREELLADFLLHGYRRADGPGRVSPALQAVRALTTAGEQDRSDTVLDVEARQRVERALDRAHRHAARALPAWAA